MTSSPRIWSALLLAGVCSAMFFVHGCSGSSDSSDAGPVGGPVDGGPDLHCSVGDDGGFLVPDGGLLVQPTSQADCHLDAGMDMDMDAGGADMSDFGPTHDGTQAYDDDCKYDVSWSSTAVRENTSVTFTVTIKDLSTNQALTGANPYIEAFLSDTHPGDTSNATTTEGSGGTYTIGPVRFDASGIWTVRFHIFGDCSDAADDSPHGHAAFFVQVP